jgi:hypothetical protein
LLCPLNLILFLAWFCPSLRLGLLALTRVWMHLLLFRLRLRLLNFWWCSIFGYTPLMSHCIAVRRLWLLLWTFDMGWPDLLVSDVMVMMAADDCRE